MFMMVGLLASCMTDRTLEEVLQSTDSVVQTFRETDIDRGNVHFSVYPQEHTTWIEEQRAWRETCILMDQSYHLANYYLEGPEALSLNAALGINRFDDWEVGELPRAKQHPVVNPDGYIIGDPILFHLDEEQVVVTGNRGLAQKWIQYNVETGDWEATVTDVYSPYGEGPPVDYRFEIQGPTARLVLGEALDGPIPDITFFGMDEISINGRHAYLLGHGMASAPGYEIFGPYEYHDEIRDLLLDIGQEHGLRQLGAKAYKTATVTTGWLPPGLPAIYEAEELAGYRRWLDEDAIEAKWSLGGSFASDDLTDYYLDAVELGYDHLIDFDHEFVGREALAERIDNPSRKKVTFVWNADDVVELYGSLFREGDTYKFAPLPDLFQQWALGHYDRIERGGDLVGVSMFSAYDYNERALLSLGVIDIEHSDPGTAVTLVWGEEGSPKLGVERHVETEIRATVASTPFVRAREDL
jgi:vanillate/3-O-methylgallate O-demethylase